MLVTKPKMIDSFNDIAADNRRVIAIPILVYFIPVFYSVLNFIKNISLTKN